MKHYFSVRILFVFFFLLEGLTAFSQTFSITGRVIDSTDATPLFGAVISLTRPRDTTAVVGGGVTDTTGTFRLTNLQPGPYRLKINFTGYSAVTKRVFLRDSSVALGTIYMHPDGLTLKTYTVGDKMIRVSQNGDTTQYNAGAYKTNPDASAEDLVKKLPGVTSDNGTLKVNGEEVKQVTVDGKTYMGDDPNAALKNIPADMIDQVQVYDKASDQSQFTGFDDGNSKKTINIVTKKQTMNGQFGKVYAGYGTNDRYNAGVTLNLFNNDQRLTILGMSNNINQQNFSMQDIFGATGGGPMSKGGGMMFRGGGGMMRGAAGNFMVSQQNGISTTHAFGVNYSDDWGPKVKVSGSYFFNYSENANTTDLTRTYFASSDSLLNYYESSAANTRNINHRFNFKFEYTIDSANALVIAPRFTSQFTDYNNLLNGSNTGEGGYVTSSTITSNASLNQGYTFGNNITYRHKFKKPGRTLTFDLSTSVNQRNGSGTYYSAVRSLQDTTILDQNSTLNSNGYTISPTLTWTEKAGKQGLVLFTYSPSLSRNDLDKLTSNYDATSELYSKTDSLLSNKYKNDYLTQRGGVAYKYGNQKASLTVGADYQYATLSGDQSYPYSSKISRNFTSVLPNAHFNYKFNKSTNLRMHYRASNNAPSISQLQQVIDNSNPLQLKTGNPELGQDFSQMMIVHFSKANTEKATGFFVFSYFTLTQNYIGNSTFIAPRDTTLSDGTFLLRGSQLTKPVNLDGYGSGRIFTTYSFPLTKLKSNLSFNLATNYTRTPALINGLTNYSSNMGIGPGVNFNSNISEKVDFTLGYNGNYNIVKNTIQSQSDISYFTHTASFRLNLMPYKGLVLNTTLDQTFYSGLGQGYNSNYLLWNASVGYKFLKNKSLEAKVSAFDILKQNTSVSRTITETYIEDSRSNTLQQYFMATVTWNIKNYKKPAPAKQEGQDSQQAPPPQNPTPGGNPPPPPPPGN